MTNPKLDELLEQLDDAREAGRELDLEQLCADCPELLEPLRERWKMLNQFDDRFGTRRESTSEVVQKLSVMPESLNGKELLMNSRLQIETFCDRGGLGDVYRAKETALSRDVAIKILRADRQHPTNLEDFARESQIIGRMSHPGIVSVYGQGNTDDGRPYYVMPFLDRGNLRASTNAFHRENRGRLDESKKEFRDLLYRLVSVGKTVAYAHSRGIVHRDLKAENVLLGKYGETLVIDWGCATQVDRDDRFKVFGERTIQLSGVVNASSAGGLTLRYASPEQLHGSKPIGPESDIYSLGSILYLIVTGESPLENVPDELVRRQVLADQVPGPELIKSGISNSLAAICGKAMAFEPLDRYRTALHFAEDLERYLADESVSVCPDSFGVKIVRLAKRNRSASVTFLALLLISSVLLFLAFAGQSVLAQKARSSAAERLEMAANLAANVGGFEISRRISMLEFEAARSRLVEAMLEVKPDAPATWERVQGILYEAKDDLSRNGIQLESMFITDANGLQVARAPRSDSIGESFAYRQYFHGQFEDIDPSSSAFKANPPKVAPGPVISNAYVSTTVDEKGELPIKTAFTVPIVHTDGAGTKRILGRLGMSVRINDLSIFQRLSELNVEAVLIETRSYSWGSTTARGIILDRMRTRDQFFSVPEEADDSTFRDAEVDVQDHMPRLSQSSIENLYDAKRGIEQAGTIGDFYDPVVSKTVRDAAFAQVKIPYRADLTTGWTVLFIESDE